MWAPGGDNRPYEAPKTAAGSDRAYYVRGAAERCLLFFTDDPHQIFPGAQIDIVQFADRSQPRAAGGRP